MGMRGIKFVASRTLRILGIVCLICRFTSRRLVREFGENKTYSNGIITIIIIIIIIISISLN